MKQETTFKIADHDEWWRSLSMNEQKAFIKAHPYYSKFDSLFVIQVQGGIKELYEYSKAKAM
jgi:hypothetical protein